MPVGQFSPRTSLGPPLREVRVESGRCRRSPSPARRGRSEISDLGGAPWALAAGLVLLFARPLAVADKVDVIHLKNGDRITCEIKGLDRSILSISTDPLGKASVHWGEVADLASPREFDVQLRSGQHYLGSLLASPPGRMVLGIAGGATTNVALEDVIRLAAIGSSIWNRVDGSVDAGFSFAQTHLETHLGLNGTATYRSPQYQLTATVAAQLTRREGDEPPTRHEF